MRSDVIAVSSTEDRTELALDQAERVAVYRHLSRKGALHLRLLTEEMMSMVRAIAGNMQGRFWIESEGEQYELHLCAKTPMNFDKREKLLSASTSGRNEAHRGFMGKIRAFFEPVDDAPLFFDPGPDHDMTWTLHTYQTQVRQFIQQDREGAAEAWDELEKSVVAHVADDVKVSIRGSDVEMTIFKKLA